MGFLTGTTVIEFGQMYSAPYCTMLMAQLGAEVVKVEAPEGDASRKRKGPNGRSTAFDLLNSGKRSVVIDLKQESGLAQVYRMIEACDVVIENFSPNVAGRLGIGYEKLKSINDDLIYGSIKGFRSSDELGFLPAMDLTVQAVAGVMATTGFEDRPPVKAGPAIADFLAGVHLMGLVCAALYRRGIDGTGTAVEVSMFDCVVPTLASNIAGFVDSGGTIPERVGNRQPAMAAAPYNIYPAADGWISILALSEAHWRNICIACEMPDFADDASLASHVGRVRRMDEIDCRIASWTRALSTSEIVSILGPYGIPMAPVVSLAKIIDEQTRKPDGIVKLVDHGGQSIFLFGSPFQAKDIHSLSPAPEIGADNAWAQEKFGVFH